MNKKILAANFKMPIEKLGVSLTDEYLKTIIGGSPSSEAAAQRFGMFIFTDPTNLNNDLVSPFVNNKLMDPWQSNEIINFRKKLKMRARAAGVDSSVRFAIPFLRRGFIGRDIILVPKEVTQVHKEWEECGRQCKENLF